MAPKLIQEAHKYVDGMPKFSRFDFDDVTNCLTCIKANLKKNSPTKPSISKMVTFPYQGFFIDFSFSGPISNNEERKVVPSSHKGIEGINGETA